MQKIRDFKGSLNQNKNEELELKFFDLEQRVVEENLKKIKNFENDNQMAERLGALKEKYNLVVK